MVPFFLLVVIISASLSYRAIERRRRQDAAMTYWQDMGKKYHELIDDPFMSSEKWREWLPIFEDADRRFEEAYPHVKDFFRYGDVVRAEIDDLPCQEVGSLS